MHWYGGSIAEAVNLSKQKNAIFVVFVEGDNALSEEMAETIDDSVVLCRLSDEANFLAIKLKSGSANYIHFAQIYQFVPVPSLFFIGRNGTPLEVVCAGVEPSNLATRIDRILEEHFKDKQPSMSSTLTVQASTSSTLIQPPIQPTALNQNVEQTVNFVQTEAAAMVQQTAPPAALEPESASGSPLPKMPNTESAETKTLTPEDMICEDNVCIRRPATADEPGPSQAPTPSLPNSPGNPEDTVLHGIESGGNVEEKMERAKELIEARRREKADKEKEDTVLHGTESGGSVEEKMERAKELIEARRREKADKEKEATVLHGTESEGSVEEKMERAKELIEVRRREKADKEKELEKEKEIERRQAGKGVAELKRWQADQELKQIQEERRREKMENNLVRQRILEQIAQDRAERRARDQPQSTQPQPSAQPAPTSGDGGGRARIQFKLPDGTSHTAHFDADGTLREVQRYVTENLRLSSSNFSLWTAFPRRELNDQDASLRGLQLAPSAALLVLPRRTAAVVARPSSMSTLITFFTQLFTTIILEPSQNLVTWLRARLGLDRPRGPAPGAAPAPAPSGAAPAPAAPGGARRRGNIHRLPSDRPEDDNNTWNGNSTQQM